MCPEVEDAETKPRQPSEDVVACSTAVMAVLESLPPSAVGHGVTAGWIEDRGIGFTEYTIGCALRRLATQDRVMRATDGTFVFWSIPDEAAREARRKKRSRFGSRT